MGSVFETTAIRQHANLCKLAHESHCGKSADRADMILTKKHNKHEECINVLKNSLNSLQLIFFGVGLPSKQKI